MKPPVPVLVLLLVATGIFLKWADRVPVSSGKAVPAISVVSAAHTLEEAADSGSGDTARLHAMEFVVPRERDAADEDLRQLEADLRQAIQIKDEEERRVALATVCVRWARFDPVDALALAREIRFEAMSDAVQADIIQQWAASNLAAARAWVDREPAGEQRENLLARLAYVWSQTQPSAAARLVAHQIAPGPAQEEAGIAVLHQWALRDFTAAFAWAEGFPAGTSRERAFAELNQIASLRTVRSEAQN